MIDIEKINFEKLNGLVPAIIVDNTSSNVLMLGFMNKEALKQTIKKGKVVFFSRSRKKLWLKGETSKNYLNVVSINPDCDNDALLIFVIPHGPTCHTGNYSCFSNIDENNVLFLEYLFNIIKSRKKDLPEKSYTASLFERGSDRITQKIGEEAVETIIAAKNGNKEEIINETSDLLFHLLVMLADQNIEISDIISKLKSRHKTSSGIRLEK